MTITVWTPEQSVRSGNEFKTSMGYPAVTTLPNGGYVIGWSEKSVLKFKVFNGSGESNGQVYFVDQAGIGVSQNNLRIQAIGNDGSFAISWNATAPFGFDLKTRVFTADDKGGFAAGDIQTVGNAFLHGFSIANMDEARDGGYVRTYENGTGIAFEVHNSSGERAAITTVVNNANAQEPDVARIGDNKYVVTYYNGINVKYKIVDTSSVQPTISSEFSVFKDDTARVDQVVGLKDDNGNLTGKFAIVRHQHNSKNLFATFYNADGSPLNNGASTLITQNYASSDGTNTSLELTALRGERIALTYRNALPDQNAKAVLSVVDTAGAVESMDLSPKDRSHPRVMEMEDGRLAISWADGTEGYTGIDMMIVDPRVKQVTVEGTARADIYYGTAFDLDILFGRDGNDKLYGGGGSDILNGGAGADLLDGGAGDGDMADYAGSSALQASLGGDFANTGDALGDIYVSIENLTGGAGNDILGGDAGANHIYGGGGDNRLYGGAGVAADTLEGGDQWDIATYEYSRAGVGITLDLLNAGAANRSTGEAKGDVYIKVDAYGGTQYADTFIGANTYNEFWGHDGNDTLIGGTANDFLEGGNGDDILLGGADGDTMVGGAGIDFASYENATKGVTASLADRTQNTNDAAGDYYSRPDTPTSIEGLIGSAHNDTLIGDDNANTLEGGAGSDILRGNGGRDTVSYVRSNAGVVVNLAAKVGSGGDAQGDTYDSIENAIGSSYNDTFIADANANALNGGGGIDTVNYSNSEAAVTVNLATGQGAGGNAQGDTYSEIENVVGSQFNDVLFGNGAANVLIGGNGDDSYYISFGDVVVENAGEGTDTIFADINYTLSANIESLTGIGGGALALTGNELNNTITGNAAGNWIDGGIGADTMIGGAGDDFYVIDNAGDVIIDNEGNNTVLLKTAYDLSMLPSSVNATIADGVNMTLTGTNGSNVLRGNAAANILKGMGGNDKLYGLEGNDKLYGGSGKDTFIFDTRLHKSKNVDKIYDFKSRDDSIWLDNAIFKKLGKGTPTKPEKLKSGMFYEGDKAHDNDDRIIYDKKTGNLYYDADGTGKSAQVKFATLTNKTKLYYHDFFVI
ncbi:hypothetical protein AB4072_13215 [Microvirga sp. 2MCAF38]|uniref:hypothetical protein n=1 Tax=Microvirga sp. 2MCAF38 TaxID=3232989 RepID=UPI003F9AB59C